MPASSLILIGIITPMSGILGSLVWPVIQRHAGWTNLRVLVTLVCLASLLPAYGCLGFLSVFRNGNVRFGGLTTPGEMYGLAVYFVSKLMVVPDLLAHTDNDPCIGNRIRRFPRLCSSILLRVNPTRRRSTLVRRLALSVPRLYAYIYPQVRVVLYHGQGMLLIKVSESVHANDW